MNKKYKVIYSKTAIILLIIVIYLSGDCIYADKKSYKPAVNGIMDLREWSSQADGSIKLEGQWEFYWKQLLSPQDLQIQEAQNVEKQYINVPSSWNNHPVDGKAVGGDGFATYKLTILVPKDAESMALRLSSIYTAHKLWVNGELMNEQGKVGTTKEESIARHYRKVIPLEQRNGQIVLVLQVSNFMHRMGGIWSPIIFGGYDDIKDAYDLSVIVDIFIFGVLLSLGIFYIAFYFIKKQEMAALYFGMFCLILSLRAVSVGNILIIRFFQQFSQEAVLRLEYMTFYGGIAAFAGFIKSMFPQEVSRKIWIIAKAVALIGTMVVVLTPPSIFSRILIIFQVYTILLLAYLLYALLKAVLRKKVEAWLVIISGIIFFGTVINDILYYNEKSSIGNLYPLGVMILAFTQALLILKRFTDTFSLVEMLNKQLVDKDKLKDEFLDDVAHGFLTPVYGMIGIAEALCDEIDGRLNESQKSNLELIVSNGRRLANLVNDIQDFSKLKNRDIILKPDNMDLGYVADSVIAICRSLIQNRYVKLVNEIPPGFIYVKADENRIYQVFYNLIENAIKFTPSGEIVISAVKKDHEIEVKVSDTGIGIPEDKLHSIFEPYVQIQEGKNIRYGGLGLGLFITKKLIELHGGAIEVESKPNMGTSYIFSLPAGTKPDEIKRKSETAKVKETVTNHVIKDVDECTNNLDSILIVDDEGVNRQVLKNYLIHEGYNIDTASGGKEALAAIEGCRYDLVILDIMMPDMSGYEVCQAIRERFTLTELPVLVISVKNRAEDIIRVFEVGANDYLGRSFDKKELLARVKTLIMMKKSAKEAVEAQLGFLQAQIKPHFLYNTLNSIMGMCIDQPEKAHELLGEFSNYLRGKFGLKSMDNPIPLGMELSLVRAYLNIEKSRFGDKLNYEMNIDVSEDQLILPLVLQPLVENAVKHGIYNKTEGGKIIISAKKERSQIMLCVEDDGIGMSEEKIKSILSDTNHKKGIGLKNVEERLMLFYGEKLTIESSPGNGTRVYIRIPES